MSGACPTPPCSASNGSGGGGGSSFYTSTATGNIGFQSGAGQNPSVTLTPLIEVDGPTEGVRYRLGQVVNASYSCLDTCSGTVPSGSPIDTSTVGDHTFQVSDRAQSHPAAVSVLHYTVTRATSTALSCVPGSVFTAQASSCTATVTDTDSGTASAPTGSVGFASNAAGSFTAASCTLASIGATQSRCAVSYTPTAIGPGTHQVTASYGGDGTHGASSGPASLTVSSPLVAPALITKTTLTESKKGVVTLPISDPNTVPAQGDVKLTAKSKKKTVTYGHATFSALAHGTAKVKVQLSKAGRAYLTKHKSLHVTATVILTGSGASKTDVQAVTIKRAKKKKH